MRPGQQNKRGRGRNNNNSGGGGGGGNFNRKGTNPLTRTYDSSGPDVKIRGTAQHIAEKYSTLARDAQSAGDRVMAENYLQHAEHYNRIIAAAQAQMQDRFQRDERPDMSDRDFNDRDDDLEMNDEPMAVTAPAAVSRPAPAPTPAPIPAPAPVPVQEIAGTGPQPIIEDLPQRTEASATEGEGDAEPRAPRRRNPASRPRRQPRRPAEGGEPAATEAAPEGRRRGREKEGAEAPAPAPALVPVASE